jgi:hypothetical protein
MGTSQSKPSTPGGSPLVAPWADQDPPAPDQPQPAPTVPDVLPQAPLSGVRRALREYMGSGDRAVGRSALGRYARAMGGTRASARHARAARTGGAALSALASIAQANGAAVAVVGFDLATLAGRPLEDAITAIVDEFCPTGILDEDVIRSAMAEALFEALGDQMIFDLNAVTDHVVVVATVCFVAELVFASVAAEQGKSAENVSPATAVQRENALRDLVRAAADEIATPIVQRTGGSLNPAGLDGIVAEITSAVYGEMARW